VTISQIILNKQIINKMDWKKLTFDYSKANTMVYSHYKNGKWSPLESSNSDSMNINVMSGGLQYANEAFEGMKAYRGVDGKIRIFRPDENASRLKSSADFLGIACPSEEMFMEACLRAVKENIEFIPPYETRASMYIRPFVFGSNPQINLVCSDEATFIVVVTPIGNFTGTNFNPTKALLARDHDRAAPLGTGSYKIGANYAAAMLAGVKAKNEGYSAVLYLDSKEHKYIDEFGSSNFFAIRGNAYITPDSPSILPSITNKSLRQIAKDLGMSVENRKIPVEELRTFDEAGACGTALVITPIHEIHDRDLNISYKFGSPTEAGKNSIKLFKQLTGIHFGEIPDQHNWNLVI